MALTLNKTLKNLGKRNAIKVDTKGAESAISRLDKKIRALSRNVSVGARTSTSGGGGGSGGAGVIPLLAAGAGGAQMKAHAKALKETQALITSLTPKTNNLSDAQQKLNNVNNLAIRVAAKLNATKAKLAANAEKLANNERRQRFAQNMGNKERRNAKLQYEALTNWSKRYTQQLDREEKLLKRVANRQKERNKAAGGGGGRFADMKQGGLAGAGTAAALSGIPGSSTLVGGFVAGKIATGSTKGGAWGAVAAGVLAATFELAKFARQSTIASAEFAKMKLALTGVVSSNEDYAKSLNAVDEISKSLLIPQAKVMKSFTRLQAAASASGFEVDEMKKMMKGFSAALVATEGDTQNFNGVMLALSQVLGKGKAAAEEIRGQIGERLSVVIPELAASMGVTTKELDKLFDQGKVTVQNIVDLGEHLEKKYSESAKRIIKSTMNAGERLKFTMSELQLAIGPMMTNLGAGFQDLGTTIIEAIQPAILKLGELLGLTNEAQLQKLKGLRNKDIRYDAQHKIDDIYAKTWIPKDKLDKAAGMNNPLKGMAFLKKYRQSRGQKDLGGINIIDLVKIEADLKRNAGIQELENRLGIVSTSGTKGKRQGGGDDQATLQRLANAKKFVEQLKIEKQFLEDRFNLGEEDAALNKRIAEAKLQFGAENIDLIEKEIRGNEKLRKELEGRVNLEQDLKEILKDRAQALKDLANPMNQLKTITEAFEDSFSNAIREVVRGTKSIGDAVASMLNRIADAFIQNAADMAAAAASNALMKFLGTALTNAFNPTTSSGTPFSLYKKQAPGLDAVDFDATPFASGGYVNRPTNAVIGEGGEGEYIIPESKLASSLSRFQAGHRGSSVVPGGVGNSGGSGGGSGEVTVNYTGPTLNFNGDEYVPRSAVPQIINSAAMAGATAGRANTMKDLKNSRSQRSRLGL